ncbi:MAG: flagellar basal body P-ring formation chaperone FlgA [bacterium]
MSNLSQAGWLKSRPGWLILLILAIAFTTRGPVFSTTDSNSVALKTEVEKDKEPLFFSDVVEGKLPGGLADFALEKLPSPGESKFINRADIIVEARRKNKPEPNFAGRTLRTNVRRPSRLVGGKQLRERVYDLLENRFSRGELELEINQVPEELEILPGSFSIELASRSPYHELRGADWYPFKIIQRGEVVNKFRVRATLRQFSRVPVALSNLPRDSTLSEEDIIWEKRDISSRASLIPDDTAALVGLKTDRSFRAGEIIDKRKLKRPLKVHRQDRVTIIYNVGNIRVSVPGYSEDDGARGEEVIVKNNSSGKKVYAEVIGERKVKAKDE